MKTRRGPHVIIPLPITLTNVVKYGFEAIIVSWITRRIGKYIGRMYMKRELDRHGFVRLKKGKHESHLIQGAPKCLVTLISGVIVHSIMIEFELSFDGAPGVKGVKVPVLFPSSPRISGLSGMLWTEAANWCCLEPDGNGDINCTRPIKVDNTSLPESFPMRTHLMLGGSYWGCQGEDFGQFEISRPDKIQIKVIPRMVNASGCSAIRKDNFNMTLCGLNNGLRGEIIDAFDWKGIPSGRDPYIEFRRYYVTAGLWNENELLREDAEFYNEEYSITSIHYSALGVFIILILLIILLFVSRRKHPAKLVWGLDAVISLLSKPKEAKSDDDIDKRSISEDDSIYIVTEKEGSAIRLYVTQYGEGECKLLSHRPMMPILRYGGVVSTKEVIDEQA